MPYSPRLLCLAIILVAMPAQTLAQPSGNSDRSENKLRYSHLLDPFGPPSGDAQQLFSERLRIIHAKEIGESLRKKYGQTPEQLDQLLRNNPDFLKERLKNLTFDDLPAEYRKNFADKSQFEEFIQKMQKMDLKDVLQRAREAQGQGAEPKGSGGQTAETSPAPAATKNAPSDSAAPGNEPKPEEAAGSESASEEHQPNSVLGRWLLEAAKRLKDEPALRNSPALRNAIRELTRKAEGGDERWKALDKSANAIADQWTRLGQMVPVNRLWPENGFSWPRSLTPESLPKLRLPGSGSRGGYTTPSSGRPAGPDMPDSKGLRLLGVLAILAAVGFVLQRVLARARAGQFSGGASGWKLGPWPVQPTAVRTREELIRAFEYLSLLRLGPAARHWHHLAIGSALGRLSTDALATSGPGRMSAEHRRAAAQLTSFYERARYAPYGEPLPESALAAARRNLCLLAGVPTS
jgi:hypothetical protein